MNKSYVILNLETGLYLSWDYSERNGIEIKWVDIKNPGTWATEESAMEWLKAHHTKGVKYSVFPIYSKF